MGHLGIDGGVYGKLQRRLDRFPIGAPPAPALYAILKTLFTEEEAEVASRMPIRPTDLEGVARRTRRTPAALRPLLDRMAEKGLVMDFERKGKSWYVLSPTIGGFFEFVFMRVRDDIPQKEIARHMVEYAHADPGFARAVFAGKIQFARALVHESALGPEEAARILDHDRASALIREARTLAVSLCYCRHIREHEGKACTGPMEVCTTLNAAARFLVRRGLAREISRAEAQDILDATGGAGLVHVGDNVRNRPAFICHCCGCCCLLLNAIRGFRIFGAVVTSPYVALADPAACTGCGLCAKRCPIGAIATKGEEKERRAVVDDRMCLGCGVCRPACARGALRMAPRRERVLLPEDAWRRTVAMAIERGKFQNLLFDDFERLDHAVLRAVTRIVVSLPPVTKALLARQTGSRFFKALAG